MPIRTTTWFDAADAEKCRDRAWRRILVVGDGAVRRTSSPKAACCWAAAGYTSRMTRHGRTSGLERYGTESDIVPTHLSVIPLDDGRYRVRLVSLLGPLLPASILASGS